MTLLCFRLGSHYDFCSLIRIMQATLHDGKSVDNSFTALHCAIEHALNGYDGSILGSKRSGVGVQKHQVAANVLRYR